MDPLVIILIILILVIAVVAVVLILIVSRQPSGKSSTGPVSGLPHAELLITGGPHKGDRYQFHGNEIKIGRDPSCTIHLEEPLVAPFHAIVRFEGGKFTLVDTNSANGVWINMRRVWQADIAPGTQFEVGASTLALVELGQSAGNVPVPPVAPPATSSILHAPPGYDLEQRIDKGGQATVYHATRITDGFKVVIKFLNNLPYDAGGRYFRMKFEQQILIGASIRHPHCVQIIGGDAAGDPPYLIEEYLPGGSLREMMRKHPLSESDAVTLIGQICDALGYLHQRGIVHRDISLNNIMFDGSGAARLIDFGLARLASAPTRSDLGLKVGVALYMSPEQAKGDSSLITPQSDLYSLGIVAYELFSGQPPFDGSDLEILTHQLRDMPVPPNRVNPRVSVVISSAIMRALEKDPRRRFANAEDMARAFGYQAPFNKGGVNTAMVATIKRDTAWKGETSRPIRLQNMTTGAYIAVNANPMILTRAMVNPGDHTMSRKHGQLEYRDNFWWISEQPDAQSANGIYHNDVRVVEPHIVTLGDSIRLGASTLKVVD